MKITTEILTTTLSTGETVLAKRDTNTKDGYDYECSTPLRYGNETAARKKLDSISHLLSTNARSASIVKQDGRFLIFIYDAPGYQSISHDDVERMMLSQSLASMAPPIRRRYATVSGARSNPRNRHNHPTNTTDKPYYFGA